MRPITNFKSIICLVFMLTSFNAFSQAGQYWDNIYDNYYSAKGTHIVQASDGNYFVSGTHFQVTTNGGFETSIVFRKLSQNGEVLFDKLITGVTSHSKLFSLDNGQVLLLGRSSPDWIERTHLILFDALGNELWRKEYYLDNYRITIKNHELFQLGDGSFLIATQRYKEAISLIHVDRDGDLLTTKDIFLDTPLFLEAANQTKNGFVFTGILGDTDSVGIFNVSSAGKPFVLILDNQYEKQLFKLLDGKAIIKDIIPTSDDHFILTGSNKVDSLIFIKKINPKGTVLWTTHLDQLQGVANSAIEKDNKIYVAGNIRGESDFLVPINLQTGESNLKNISYYPWKSLWENFLTEADNGFAIMGSQAVGNRVVLYVIKTSIYGESRNNVILGTIKLSKTEDCLDIGEESVVNILVSAKNEQDTFYTKSDSLGHFSFQLDTGHYLLKVEGLAKEDDAIDTTKYIACNEDLLINFPNKGIIQKNNLVIIDELILEPPPAFTDSDQQGFYKNYPIQNSNLIVPQQVIKAYPNPFNDYVIFEMVNINSHSLTISLFDSTIKRIDSIHFENTITTYSTSHLPIGLYFYKVVDNSGQLVASGKIVK